MEPLELLKQIYKEKLNINESLVELMSDRDILHLTASGSSIPSISRFLDVGEEDIKNVNKSFYGFEGWDLDLDLNPLMIFNNLMSSHYFLYELFKNEIVAISPYFKEPEIEKMYEVCCKFYTIEKLLEEEWI